MVPLGPQRLLFGLPWGTGVQLFFVISGFLITGILIDNKPLDDAPREAGLRVWRSFYLRRALRIFPLFYLVIFGSLALGFDSIGSSWVWHTTYLSNGYYFLTNSRDAFGHFWSLAVEEQFYLVWPFLVLLLSIRQLPKWIILTIIVAPVFRIVIMAATGNADLSYLPISCLDALAARGESRSY